MKKQPAKKTKTGARMNRSRRAQLDGTTNHAKPSQRTRKQVIFQYVLWFQIFAILSQVAHYVDLKKHLKTMMAESPPPPTSQPPLSDNDAPLLPESPETPKIKPRSLSMEENEEKLRAVTKLLVDLSEGKGVVEASSPMPVSSEVSDSELPPVEEIPEVPTILAKPWFLRDSITHSLESSRKLDVLVETLLASRDPDSPLKLRYYIYTDKNLRRMDIRKQVKKQHKGEWSESWGHRFKEYAEHEIVMMEALERNPHMRTPDPDEADFFVVPIPIGGLVWMTPEDGSETKATWDRLFEKELFQQYPEKHVAITQLEYLFLDGRKRQFGHGYNEELYKKLKPMTIVKDIDMFSWAKIFAVGSLKQSGFNWDPEPGYFQPIGVQHSWSISYAGAASMKKDHTMKPITYDTWSNKKYYFFYHTRKEPSVCNSTQFRHLPVLTTDVFPSPSSIGWDMDPALWKEHFQDSRFCLVIRGDNPASRALWRSIRAGCLPVIISDFLPYYAPVYRSQLDMQDYAIFVKEREFLVDPVGSLINATRKLTTTSESEQRIHNLAIAQRLFVTDHPESLFAEAFAAETVASQKKDYYAFQEDLYHQPMY